MLYILGASGFAREVAVYAKEIYPDRVISFVDILPNNDQCISLNEYWERLANKDGESIIGSGRQEIRQKMIGQIKPPFATIIHPKAHVFGQIMNGCIVAPGAVVAHSAKLNFHVAVNYNATIGHDTFVGQLSIIGPGAGIGGWCTIGENVYIGAGALIREKLRIGDRSIIGMGAVVTKDVPDDMVAIGMPARFYTREECGNGWLR